VCRCIGKLAPGSNRVSYTRRLVAWSDQSILALMVGVIGCHSRSLTSIIFEGFAAAFAMIFLRDARFASYALLVRRIGQCQTGCLWMHHALKRKRTRSRICTGVSWQVGEVLTAVEMGEVRRSRRGPQGLR